MRPKLAALAVLVAAAAPAHADRHDRRSEDQRAFSERQLPASAALAAAEEALERCRRDGLRVSVVLVDRAGLVKAAVKEDGAGPHTFDTARRKAFTSATFRVSTTEFARRAQTTPALATITDVIALGGGLPIVSGGEVIGAIGVGGAPSGAQDEACAQAGIDAIAGKL
jgi:uncharacterized protein GlcG (DUF336 family)